MRPAQVPLAPAAGFVAALPDPDPYPAFPRGRSMLERMQWAREVPFEKPSARHALLLLALDAGGPDGIAYTGVAKLSRQTGLSRRGVQTALAWLSAKGWLASREGRRRSLDRRPKAPGEALCRECWQPDRGAGMCPYCGADGLLGGALSARGGALSAP